VTLFEADEQSEGPSGPTVRVRLTVAYDGSGFHGFAVNPGVRTVAGTLGEAIARVLGHAVELTCAGRTDRGVHARGQVVTFDAREAGLDLDSLARSVNHLCGPVIAVRDPTVVGDEVSARFSAKARRYRYLVLNRPDPDPFLAPTSWHIEKPLDRWAMELACDPLIGEHDFSAFCRRPKHRDGSDASLVRRVREASWSDDGDGLLRFEIEASSFCHQMVRSVVGTMAAVGLGRIKAGDVAGIIRSADRAAAGDLAPAHGLTLWSVHYDTWSS
jgi:tRNA pseudouridine38-40 synthase